LNINNWFRIVQVRYYGQGRSQAWAWGAYAPSNKNTPPPDEMKPIIPFGLGLMFFARFDSKKLVGYRAQKLQYYI